MICPNCNSNNITTLKIHITKPIGSKKHKCRQCNTTFTTNQL